MVALVETEFTDSHAFASLRLKDYITLAPDSFYRPPVLHPPNILVSTAQHVPHFRSTANKPLLPCCNIRTLFHYLTQFFELDKRIAHLHRRVCRRTRLTGACCFLLQIIGNMSPLMRVWDTDAWEAEAGGAGRTQGYPGIYVTLPQNTRNFSSPWFNAWALSKNTTLMLC